MRIGCVTGKEPRAEVSELAQLSFADKLPGILHHRGPAVVVADESENISGSSRVLNLGSLLRRLAHGLFAKDMLSGCGCGFRDLEVHVIRGCDIHHLDARVRHHVLPTRGVAFEAKLLLGFFGSLLNIIGTDDELWVDAGVMETVGGG